MKQQKRFGRKLLRTSKKKNQSKIKLCNKLHSIRFKDKEYLQENITKVEKICLEISRLNDRIAEKEKKEYYRDPYPTLLDLLYS